VGFIQVSVRQSVWCSEEWVRCKWLQEDDMGEGWRNEERKKKTQE